MGGTSGGNRVYVEQLLRAWSQRFPGDELLVLLPEGAATDVGGHERVDVVVPRPGQLTRPVVLTRLVRRLVRERGIDVVLASTPATVVRPVGAPLVVVVHDLRHEHRPDQFPLGRRVLRALSWGRCLRLADAVLAISARTAADVAAGHPRSAPVTVVHHGADHALAWPHGGERGTAVAFAHHTNKNPHLVLEALALAGPAGPPRLTLLGVPTDLRPGLEGLRDALGLHDVVTLAPYLADEEYLALVADASMFVFPSDFEGFGLPVLESMVHGVPVVIGPDPACIEVAGGHAVVADDWTAPALAEAVAQASTLDEQALRAARAWAGTFTWERTVERTRALLVDVSASAGR